MQSLQSKQQFISSCILPAEFTEQSSSANFYINGRDISEVRIIALTNKTNVSICKNSNSKGISSELFIMYKTTDQQTIITAFY